MSTWLQDVRYGVRSLIQAPAFSILTVVTLTLAIGVNSAIFSMVSVIFFSDYPFTDTDTAAFVFMRNSARGVERGDLSLTDFLDYREQIPAFRDMAGVEMRPGVLVGAGEPLRVRLAAGTANLFRVWGTPLFLGRDFAPGADMPGADRVAILSHGIWERRFGGDPEVLGKQIKIDGYPSTIIGVATKRLEFGNLALVDLWVPLRLESDAEPRDARGVFAIARLAPGATLQQADQEVTALGRQLEREHPETNRGWAPYVESFQKGLADDGFWTILLLLSITVGLVMLLACSNVATLTLTRASGRARELAVRAALGAGGARILRQLLTESLILSLVSGALGLLVARAALLGLTWLVGDAADISTFFGMLRIDRGVLLFTLAVAMASPVLFGLLPALRSSRSDLVEALKEGRGTSSDATALRGRRVLVATQVALAIMLMVVAGLVIRSLVGVRALEFGYAPERLLTMRVDLPEAAYSEPEQIRAFRRQVLERVESLAGVVRATWVSDRALADAMGTMSFEIEQAPTAAEGEVPWAFSQSVGPSFFDIMHLAPLAGRVLQSSDGPQDLSVAVVNSTAAARYWPDADVVGQRIRRAGGDWLTIVGVVTDEVFPDPENPSVPQLYTAQSQHPRSGAALVVEAIGDPLQLAAPIRQVVWSVDPEQPVADVRTQQRILADSLASIQAIASMFGCFAIFALVMAAAGIYGVLSFVVAQRTREIGIRMALGAARSQVRGMVMLNSGWLIGTGVLLGLAGAAALARLLASGIPEIDAADPAVYAAVVILLLAVAAVSAWLPARRATRVQPIVALRAE